MEAKKAIELSKEAILSLRKHKFYDYADAVLLSTEALIRHQNRDYLTYNQMHELLPGETTDG